jgi:catechol 2,3-dioxygenase-like lactoylglutathione lyase family enzyme
MPVRELFHIMAIVDDLDAAQAVVERLFDPETMMEKSWSDFDKRWATISLMGTDFSFELMEPSVADEDAEYPLVKFGKRFGSHLHSLAWYVDAEEEAALASRLIDHGVRVVDPRGGLLAADGLDDLPPTLFTHGRDTFGQLEFQVPGAMRDPRLGDDWSDERWRVEHPLGLQRLDSTTVLVRDLDPAKALFVDVLEGRLVHEREDGDGARAYVLVGTNTMVELLCPAGEDSRWGGELAHNGELPVALTLLVRDLAAARRHVEGCGVAIAEQTEHTFTTDPASTFGVPFSFTTVRIPGDPRDS